MKTYGPVSFVLLLGSALLSCSGCREEDPVEAASTGSAEDVPDCRISTRSASCLVDEAGELHCWGRGQFLPGGSEADPQDIGDDESAVSVPPLAAGGVVTDVASGLHTPCALFASGDAKCWGPNEVGQLGQGDTEPVYYVGPAGVAPISLGAKATSLATTHGGHMCAVLEGGQMLRCWGRNDVGQLGYGTAGNSEHLGDDELPSSLPAIDLAQQILDVAGARVSTCVLLADGYVRCWGGNENGELGYGDTRDRWAPGDEVVSLGEPATQLAGSSKGFCALLASGVVHCWGEDPFGNLGMGQKTPEEVLADVGETIGDDETPDSVPVISLGERAVQIIGGFAHYCAVLGSGGLRCWGYNANGQLGLGDYENVGDDEVPSTAPAIRFTDSILRVSAGYGHTCVLTNGGDVRCWGGGEHGELGNGAKAWITSAADSVPLRFCGSGTTATPTDRKR